jgi:hypothetical protein
MVGSMYACSRREGGPEVIGQSESRFVEHQVPDASTDVARGFRQYDAAPPSIVTATHDGRL